MVLVIWCGLVWSGVVGARQRSREVRGGV